VKVTPNVGLPRTHDISLDAGWNYMSAAEKLKIKFYNFVSLTLLMVEKSKIAIIIKSALSP
jgi:hypothetical protein